MSQNCSRQQKKFFSSNILKGLEIFSQNRYDFYSRILKIAWKYGRFPNNSQQADFNFLPLTQWKKTSVGIRQPKYIKILSMA